MDQEEIFYLLKHLEVFLLASIKFFLSPFEAERYGFGMMRAIAVTSAGGITGVFAFTYIGDLLFWMWRRFISLLRGKSYSENPKKFTPLRRLAVRIKRATGIWGLAMTTPVLLSIPVGTIITHGFYRKRGRNILILCMAVLLWSVVLNFSVQHLSILLGFKK